MTAPRPDVRPAALLDVDDLVVAVGGPLVGRWYTADGWQRMRAAALHMAERGQADSTVLHYAPTGRRQVHPRQPDRYRPALVWAWQPHRPAPDVPRPRPVAVGRTRHLTQVAGSRRLSLAVAGGWAA